MGFVPQLVDMNGDGIKDIFSGSYQGDHRDGSEQPKDENGNGLSDIFVFYGKEDGTFEQKVSIAQCHIHAAAMPVDWDGDGDYDIITAARLFSDVTEFEGQINYLENVGTKTEPEFGKTVNMIPDLEKKPGHDLLITSAEAWDWDDDGLLDIIAGTEWGSILYFRNIGTAEEYKFAPEPEVLVGKSTVGMEHGEKLAVLEDQEWGSRFALHILDWDGDGVVDILAGDQKSITLTEEQRFAGASEEELAEFKEAEAKMAEMQEKMTEMFQGINYQEMSEEERKAYIDKMNEFRKPYEPYQKIAYEKFPAREVHGYVWFFKGVAAE